MSNNTGWITATTSASNYSSVILKTTNAGSNWINLSSIPNAILFSIYFKDNQSGWACGQETINYEAAIYRTTNGGLNWNLQVHSGYWPLNCITFNNDTTGWCVGWDNQTFRTTDSGNNWVLYPPASGSELNYIFFINPLTGWIAAGGESGAIVKTTNGGINWTAQVHMWTGYNCIHFVNPNYGWAGGYNNNLYGVISLTTNGGNNWFIHQIGYLDEIQSVFFTDTLRGWCIGVSYPGIYIYRSNDGGLIWTQQTSSINGLRRLYFADSVTGWALAGGQILKTTNGGVNRLVPISSQLPDKFSLSQNYPNPFNPITKIRFALPPSPKGEGKDAPMVRQGVRVIVYDILGREIKTPVNEYLKPGTYEVEFDGTDLPSGLYYYKITAGQFSQTRKMILVK